MRVKLLTALILLSATIASAAPEQAPDQELTGSAARAYLDELRANNKAIQKAAARLEARGYTATDSVEVMRSVQPEGVHPAQESYSTSQGEVVFWTWSDGQDGTWEGMIYAENYSTGASATWDAQIDVSTTDFPVLWEELVDMYAPPSGGHYMTSMPPRPRHAAAPQIASLGASIPLSAMELGTDVELVQSGPSVRRWLSCTLSYCMRRTMCVLAGPGCFVTCGGAGVGCAIQNLM